MPALPDPTRFSSIGRALDPGVPTNRAVLVLVPLAALAGALVGPTLVAGALLGAGAAFGAWALARELAPDDDPAAFLAMGLGVATVIPAPSQSLLLLFALLLLTRVVNRTVGPAARLPDTLAIAGLAGWATWSAGGWPLALTAAAAFALDRRLKGEAPGLHAPLAVGFAALAAGLAIAGPHPWPRPSVPVIVGCAATLVVYGRAVAGTRTLRSVADATAQRLDPTRVRAAMLLPVLAAAPGLTSWGPAPADLATVWTTLAAVGVAALRPRPGPP